MREKPILLIQLRADDKAQKSELNAILKTAKLDKSDIINIRGEITSFSHIDFSKYSALIVGGSPFDVTIDEKEKTDIQKRVESDFEKIFNFIVKNDFPFLGICSGNGLLTRYLGGKMSKKYGEPVSGIDIYLTEEGKKDKLLKNLPPKFRALVGHKEACELPPPGASVLAYSKSCPTQMLRIKNNIYSTQFHPEADFAEFKLRINIYRNYGYFPPHQAEEIINKIRQEVITEPQKILQNFVRTYYFKHQ